MKFKPSRAHVAFAHDVVMAASSFVAALYLRLGDGLWLLWSNGDLLLGVVLFVAVAVPVFLSLRLYRGVWRYASTNDMVGLVRAATLTVTAFTVLLFLVNRLQTLPRSVLIINWLVLLILLGGPRFIYRNFKDRRQARRFANPDAVPALLVGAGDEAELFIRATRSAVAEYRAVGVVSPRGARVGRNIHGIEVLGAIDELAEVVAELRRRGQAPQRLIITDHGLDGATVRALLDEADRLGLALGRIPRLTELNGVDETVPIRPIAVEDLLGRPQQALDRSGLEAMIRGRRVMVTGAGGSIGSELVRQIAACGPERLVLFEACEFNLYSIDQELTALPNAPRVVPLLGDVRMAARVGEAMDTHRPELVFHAAALKHVPMVERNPEEGILTNAVGTRIVADACVAAGVRVMVQISTDKAVNPTNVMGATKRVAEMYAQALDLAAGGNPGGTRFVTVRFGNVLGSTGSVVPLFQKQLAAGGPLTVTHPEMTRYFMTVREAVELVLQASRLGATDAAYRGKIFVLDMGEPVRIVDLARQMIRLAGLRPDHDISIAFTGLRPGEKLFEEIFHGAEPPVATGEPGLLLAAPRAVEAVPLGRAIDELREASLARRGEAALALLRRLVPEYQPSRAGAAPAAPATE
ncbi:polysaccharide biosynthesis protein [Phaeospirillum tilakii]|uniref:Polysaccharide biosynthesis protein n=1 Tax=Phaeospirillum tilakii TaxID=741673 RepID=A0ABW5C739_9PROT